jgi:hypothetical protein
VLRHALGPIAFRILVTVSYCRLALPALRKSETGRIFLSWEDTHFLVRLSNVTKSAPARACRGWRC